MKKTKKKAKKKTLPSIVIYIEDSTSHLKKFKDSDTALDFVKRFNEERRDLDNGNWIDLVVTDIKGDIVDIDGRYE